VPKWISVSFASVEPLSYLGSNALAFIWIIYCWIDKASFFPDSLAFDYVLSTVEFFEQFFFLVISFVCERAQAKNLPHESWKPTDDSEYHVKSLDGVFYVFFSTAQLDIELVCRCSYSIHESHILNVTESHKH
jgi:hypothetical protein